MIFIVTPYYYVIIHYIISMTLCKYTMGLCESVDPLLGYLLKKNLPYFISTFHPTSLKVYWYKLEAKGMIPSSVQPLKLKTLSNFTDRVPLSLECRPPIGILIGEASKTTFLKRHLLGFSVALLLFCLIIRKLRMEWPVSCSWTVEHQKHWARAVVLKV